MMLKRKFIILGKSNHMIMKTFFKDIFEYHYYFNQQLIGQFEENQHLLSEELIRLLCHIINAHQIWNARILKAETNSLNSIHPFSELYELDTDNYHQTITIIEEVDLQTKISYQNSAAKSFVNTVAEILFHLNNHSTHHKGQLVSGLRQNGVAPIVTDYIFYKRKEA